MMKKLLIFVCLLPLAFIFVAQGQEKPAVSQTNYVPVKKYDPSRDAAKDILDALGEARRSGKRVMLNVGGEWCSWCHEMDAFIGKNPNLRVFLEEHYITVKINVSPENENKVALSAYPEIPGYPHIFVLESDGKLLQSQNTGELESGRTYDLEKFLSFLKRWTGENKG